MVAAFQVGLVPVGDKHFCFGEVPVVGDEREAAVGGGVVGDHVVAGEPAEGVAGASGAPVAGAGPARVSCRKLSVTVWLTVTSIQRAAPAWVNAVAAACSTAGRVFSPGFRPGEPEVERVDGCGAGLDPRASGVLVTGGFDGGMDPDDAVSLGRGQWRRECGPDPVVVADPFAR